jgi:hypothetical protein
MLSHSEPNNGLIVNNLTYDGSDFFVVDELRKYILVSERAKTVIENSGLTNVRFTDSRALFGQHEPSQPKPVAERSATVLKSIVPSIRTTNHWKQLFPHTDGYRSGDLKVPTFEELSVRIASSKYKDLGSGVRSDDIKAAENNLGVPIEGGYRQFLAQFGWGSVPGLELFGLGGPSHVCLLTQTQVERLDAEPALPEFLLPVATDGCGNLFCLDTSAGGDPPVVLWNHTEGTHQDPEIQSDNFVQWLWEQLETLKL